MQYMICLKENSEAPISRILGRVEADSIPIAKSEATVAFHDALRAVDPNPELVALIVQSLHLVKNRNMVYFAIKKSADAGRNEGALTRDAQLFYVNAIRNKDLYNRMLDLRDALPDIHVLSNSKKGGVMGNGSGTGYAIFARFDNTDEAVNYIQLLGYNVSGNAKFGN